MTEPRPELWVCEYRATRDQSVMTSNDLADMIQTLRAVGHHVSLVESTKPERADFWSFRERSDAIYPYAFAWKL